MTEPSKSAVPADYGKVWQGLSNDFWVGMYGEEIPYHDTFLHWLARNKGPIETALEVGCGSGVYLTEHADYFRGISYTGIDISESAIDYAKSHSTAEFIAADFLQWEDPRTFDLVFSHAVIDHIYDPEEFLRKIVAKTRKVALISSPSISDKATKKVMDWSSEGFYLNTIPVSDVKAVLREDLSLSEFNISPFENGHIIEIVKDVR